MLLPQRTTNNCVNTQIAFQRISLSARVNLFGRGDLLLCSLGRPHMDPVMMTFELPSLWHPPEVSGLHMVYTPATVEPSFYITTTLFRNKGLNSN